MHYFKRTRPEVFCKKGVLRNFEEFTGKHLCQSLFFNKVSSLRSATLFKKRVWHWRFPVNFAKILRTLLLQNTSGRLLLRMDNEGIFWQFPNQYTTATLQNTCRWSFFIITYDNICYPSRMVLICHQPITLWQEKIKKSELYNLSWHVRNLISH